MDYNKILESLAKNVKFSKYDAFSTEKRCHYITLEDKEYALMWQTVKVDKMNEMMDNLSELKKRIDEAKKSGARLPAILAIYKDNNHIFQLQEKVNGKKFGYYEILDQKTSVEDFVELLITFDLMSLYGLSVESGRNCYVDEDGHINLFDCVLAKKDDRHSHNAKPEMFKRIVFPEPDDYTEKDCVVLKRILEKWIVACVKYFSMCNMDEETIYDEIDLTIKNYSFISKDEKKELIKDVLGRTLQKKK